ncbi:hypothetical protein KDY119_03040 [Luteimicrobium xylanilyticum]|uniref:Uncharacterized protein n=1 Tax=Luteimicrobium xylanilyticum TaxID=1133546 RepID=A0A5P9QE02_9MICO|nr:hypothetical protein [Luteimicrobium xylanilyticum]QFU99509.1 hypothetical protein KDY119_03040 [Luteimicrobium xylanilyticum]
MLHHPPDRPHLRVVATPPGSRGRPHLAPCAAGCVRPAHHRPGCADPCCDGCLPRPAGHGVLCDGCHARLALALRRLPAVVRDHADRPDEPQALRVYDAVATWVRDALELYPVPTERPARLDAAVHAPAHGPVTRRHRPLGLGDAAGLGDAVRALCGWLDRHLPWVEAQPWAARLAAELGDLAAP